MDLSFVFFLFLLSFFLIPSSTIARGGDRIPIPSGFLDKSSELLTRHLFEDKQRKISEALTDGYMSNTELEKSVTEFGQRCANISRIYSIGKSVNGSPLLVIEISDKPGKEEAEPAFKFIGNVHGDEPVGRELLMLLANWLCSNYMKDSLATMIVKNVHLHILPTMNPDGFALRRRGNANNVDLNRDFPDQFYPVNDVEDMRQPETRAIMNWVKNQQFAASASLHGGALVANYPWDGSQDSRKKYVACPDDKAFRYMASIYSQSHYNMSSSTEFAGGITNGAQWYPIYGGMQDWNYIHGGCLELTLEISDDKWPRANELPILFEYNRKSMLNLVASLVKSGIHGRTFSSDTYHPLPASVTINGIDYKTNSSRRFGYYYRFLAPSESYEVMVTMPGYESKTTRILLEDEAMSLDFILDPEVSDAGRQVDDCYCNCDGQGKLVVGILRRAHLEMYLAIFVILLFLCFLLKRKAVIRFLKRRHFPGHKRAIEV
ncbi:carboxypeptidase SOL1 [Iris pallida]|uniref:Carboxypeptidase SOL1 n=1 Tax=Iris pallida TaxID=29817 RepID=A0AAX6HWW5_IRIPA|nr:carboxypeptidase SOL1 [Iris pallida]